MQQRCQPCFEFWSQNRGPGQAEVENNRPACQAQQRRTDNSQQDSFSYQSRMSSYILTGLSKRLWYNNFYMASHQVFIFAVGTTTHVRKEQSHCLKGINATCAVTVWSNVNGLKPTGTRRFNGWKR